MTAQPNWAEASSSRNVILDWRTSSASNGVGECVEVATSGSVVLARDSRDRSGAVLEFTPAQWLGLTRRIRQDRAVRD
jgi:Domain of unknown function (DUF397)